MVKMVNIIYVYFTTIKYKVICKLNVWYFSELLFMH